MTLLASPTRPSFQTVADAIASRQHGVVTRRQLLDAGVAPSVIEYRLAHGWLVGVHRGVYRFGPLVTAESDLMAACLACGPSAAASHESAALLHRVMPPTARPREPAVSVVSTARRRPGIRIHRVARLAPSDVMRVNGVPATTIVRTLCDLAPRLTQRALERAVAEALALRLTTLDALERAARRRRGRAGAAMLLDAVGGGGPARVRSELEDWFLDLVTAARLPPPEVNIRLLGFEVDFLWRSARVVVETDGFGAHRSREAFEGDRDRDAELAVAGYTVMRVTWRKLRNNAGETLARLIRLLDERG
jgi:hypothetical protein